MVQIETLTELETLVTIISATVGGVGTLVAIYATMRPEGFVARSSEGLGVDPIEVGGGVDEFRNRCDSGELLEMAVEECSTKDVAQTAIEELPAGLLLQELQSSAEGDDGVYPSDLAAAAGNVCEPSLMIEMGLMGEDVDRAGILDEHLSDGELETLLDDRDLWPDPIDQVATLDDDPERCFAWVLSDDSTVEDRASLAREIESTFIEAGGREPEALHLVVGEVDEIAELDSETVKRYIRPWLKDTDVGKEASE